MAIPWAVHRAAVAKVDAVRRDLGPGFQVVEPLLHDVLMLAADMCVSGVQKGKQANPVGSNGAGLIS